jgi:hypothetical protein
MIIEALAVFSMAAGIAGALEDHKTGYISEKNNIAVLVLLFLTLVYFGLRDPFVAAGGVVAIALLMFIGVGGADIKFAVLYSLLLAHWSKTVAVLFLPFSLSLPLFVPSKESLRFFLTKPIGVGVIVLSILTGYYLLILVAYTMYRIGESQTGMYEYRPLKELTEEDLVQEVITRDGRVMPFDEVDLGIPVPDFLRPVLSEVAVRHHPKVRERFLYVPPRDLTENDVEKIRELWSRYGAEHVRVARTKRMLPWIVAAFPVSVILLYVFRFFSLR